MDDLKVLYAMQDDEFQKILQNDEILQKLENEKYNFTDEYLELMSLYSGQIQICGLRFNYFTLGLWCFLYSIRNAFAIGENPTHRDIDIVLYLLQGYQKLDEELYQKSQNFCHKNNIPYEIAEFQIYSLLRICFRALEMLPTQKTDGDKPHYNMEWLTQIVKIVSNATNCEREFILYKMKLPEVFYYVVLSFKQNDTKNLIRRRNSDEINAEIFKRTMELGQQYYNSKYKEKSV